ncbi:MAG TPA: L-aspartate oxidase [Thermoanaerobaculia bacterium]|nr:L-aspartate oxidase [Thermoanaerobaculia bacterium]
MIARAETRWDEERSTDVVVVGSGAAGLSAALGALGVSDRLQVTLVTKGALDSGSSPWAQGGVAVALGADDSPARHAEDTLRVAGGLADASAVKRLTALGPEEVTRLVGWGARLDRTGEGALALAREAGHRRPRIVHAGGDATGAELIRVLGERARREAGARGSRLRVEEGLFAAEVLLAGAADAPRVAGVLALRGRRRIAIRARAVVVATGGYGQLFLHTTNPPEVTGDGIAMAARAGAALADLEFVQFHPTALRAAQARSALPLLTEALRGAGATLVDAGGRRFMLEVHPDGELAPRDVVARALFERVEDGLESYLDLRAAAPGDATALAARFPTAWRGCREHGFDPAERPVPVTPAAHYVMGGIWVDARGRSSLAGLWACGEAASSGVHGANRLASNSLLEALVLGREVGAAAARTQPPRAGALRLPAAARPMHWGRRRLEAPAIRRAVRSLMWRHVGIVRVRPGLLWALGELDRLAAALPEGPSETRNLLELGRWVTAAALLREESRGAHHRSDFPQPGAQAHRTIGVAADLLAAARAQLGGAADRSAARREAAAP